MSSSATRLVEGWAEGFGPVTTGVLTAASRAYRGLLATREWLYASGVARCRALPVPVVSVGNLTVGGTGKTPAVELAVRTLIDLGHRPAVVSRGYRRRSRGVQVVADAAAIRLDADEGGDEPFLLARRLPGVPVVVGGHRYEAGRQAVERFAVTAIVLDDGFQHRTLRKSLEIVLARARSPWGNGRLLPAGPLREPLSALRRAQLIVASGARDLDEADELVQAARRHAPGVPVLAACYEPSGCLDATTMRDVAAEHMRGRRLLAFAGIAAPDGFRRTLQDLGVGEVDFVAFRDHHWFSPADVDDLVDRAERGGADGLVTTEKDWARLRQLGPLSVPVLVVGVRLVLRAGQGEWRRAFEQACPRP